MAEQTFIESKTGTNTSRKIDKIKPRIWKKNLCKTFWFPKKTTHYDLVITRKVIRVFDNVWLHHSCIMKS